MSSVFLQLDQPGSAVWLYTCGTVAIAVFFQFTRPLLLRNWDLLGLFLFTPGFLLIEDSRREGNPAERIAGYGWLLFASAVWFVRCLLDAGIVRRPLVAPNLTPPGLFWLAGAILLGLCVSTLSKPISLDPVSQRPQVREGIEPTPITAAPQESRVQASAPDTTRFWVARILAVGCQIALTFLLVRICVRHFQDITTAAVAAALYLLLPVTGYQFDQSNQVWPTALLLGAILSYRNPTAAGLFLGLAVGTSFFPLVLIPAWVQFYHGRGSGRFIIWATAATGGSLLVSVPALALAGEFSLGLLQPLNLTDWQPWRVPTAESVWTGGRWVYRLPLFVAYVGFVATTVVWPKVRNLGQLIAVSAAVLIGIQFWFADRGGVYVLWYAPLLILMVLRPTTTDLVPPPVNGVHLFRWLQRGHPNNGVPSPGIAV